MVAKRDVVVRPVCFTGRKKDGDYEWMVKQPAYARTLFVMSENFLDSVDPNAEDGGGTACLRRFSSRGGESRLKDGSMPRSVGVPTGFSLLTQGFGNMAKYYVQMPIDIGIERISLLLDSGEYDQLVFSCNPHNTEIGTSIFKDTIGSDVIHYITTQLNNVVRCEKSKATMAGLYASELQLMPFVCCMMEAKKNEREAQKHKLEALKYKTLFKTLASSICSVDALKPMMTQMPFSDETARMCGSNLAELQAKQLSGLLKKKINAEVMKCMKTQSPKPTKTIEKHK